MEGQPLAARAGRPVLMERMVVVFHVCVHMSVLSSLASHLLSSAQSSFFVCVILKHKMTVNKVSIKISCLYCEMM